MATIFWCIFGTQKVNIHHLIPKRKARTGWGQGMTPAGSRLVQKIVGGKNSYELDRKIKSDYFKQKRDKSVLQVICESFLSSL